MTIREQIFLSIDLKDKKINNLHKHICLCIESKNYEKIIKLCEAIKDLQSQIKDLNDLLDVKNEKEFDEQFEILKKYLEV